MQSLYLTFSKNICIFWVEFTPIVNQKCLSQFNWPKLKYFDFLLNCLFWNKLTFNIHLDIVNKHRVQNFAVMKKGSVISLKHRIFLLMVFTKMKNKYIIFLEENDEKITVCFHLPCRCLQKVQLLLLLM